MHVVAITHLASSIDDEAKALAAELGSTAYEERLNLVAGLPAIVLSTAQRERADAVLAGLCKRGHRALYLDARAIVPSASMISMRRFVFEPDAVVVDDGAERLPYDDIHAMVRAVHRVRTENHVEVKTKKFGMGRAIASGGLFLTKTVSKQEKSVTSERDQVLYVFRASGKLPWLLRERGTNYGGLGSALAPSSAQNFAATITRLRERASGVFYDDRLVTPRGVGRAGSSVALRADGANVVSTTSGMDLLAHVLAASAVRSPYR